MREQSQWDEVKAGLRRVHRETNMLQDWIGDQDKFVKDVMDLVFASYSEGAADAFDEVEDFASERLRKLDAMWVEHDKSFNE